MDKSLISNRSLCILSGVSGVPRLFGYLALLLAIAFAALGVIFLLDLTLPAAVTAFGAVQALCWLAAAVPLIVHRKHFPIVSRAKGVGPMILLMGTYLSAPRTALAADPVDMHNCSGAPCVMVHVGRDKSLKLAIDTVNNRSMVDLAVAKEMRLVLTPYTEDNNPYPGLYQATLKDVRLGEEQLGDLDVLVADLGIKKGDFPDSSGSLSYVDLKDRRVVLDYLHQKIQVLKSTPDRECGANCGHLTYPTFGRQGPPSVVTTGFRINGQPVTMQIDTLYAGTMLIYSMSIEKLSLQHEAAASRIRNFPLTDGGVEMIEGQATTESFGSKRLLAGAPLYFPTPKVHQADGMFDGTVGSTLFQGHTVTLDFHTNQFWML